MKLSFFKTVQMKNKTFNIRTSNNNSSKVQTILLEGDLGINNSVAIKKSIQAMIIYRRFSYDSNPEC